MAKHPIDTLQMDQAAGSTIAAVWPPALRVLADEELLRLGVLLAKGGPDGFAPLAPAQRLALAVLQGDREAALLLADMVQEEWQRAHQ